MPIHVNKDNSGDVLVVRVSGKLVAFGQAARPVALHVHQSATDRGIRD